MFAASFRISHEKMNFSFEILHIYYILLSPFPLGNLPNG
jgi:hypothetical protein